MPAVLIALILVLGGLISVERAYDDASATKHIAWVNSESGARYARCQVRPLVNQMIPDGMAKPEPCSPAELRELQRQRAAALGVGLSDALAHLLDVRAATP
ncbi:hypothetical protein [Rhodovibrio sodomensis]|uniref:hypothetical protein n=1 Tax=Rhodovibrio sodomensis TaxID=1088 RepID=UPI00190398AF|nr:hypothetical protein [Rhodovibrio sodomensis]